MPKTKLLLSVDPRDCDADGYYDLRLDMPTLARQVRGSAWIEPIARATGAERDDVLRSHVPGAHLDEADGVVSINEGYDPAAPAGRLEHEMWDLVKHDVLAALRRSTGRKLRLAA